MPVARRLGPGDDRLGGGHAERAAHELEILHGGDNRRAFHAADPDQNGILQSGLRLCGLEAIRVAALVAEAQGIGGDAGERHGFPLRVVEEEAKPGAGIDTVMVAGAGEDELVRLQVLVEGHLAGLGTFDPEILGDLALRPEAADLWADDIGNPVQLSLLLRPP